MSDLQLLAAGVVAQPADNARWLILADCLAEHPDVEPLLEDAIRSFIAGRKFKSCDRWMYSCSEILTNGDRQRDLGVLVVNGCENCRHWANSQIAQDRLIEILERLGTD